MEVHLLVRSNSEEAPRGYVFPMKGRVVLGRSPESAVPLEGTSISREHLVLELVGDTVYATDLSNNGTWVNGNRLRREERIQLSSGDSMELPDYQISFRIQEKAGTPAPTPERIQAGTVSVVVPSDLPPARQSPVNRQTHERSRQEKTGLSSFTVLEIWTFLLALLALGVIAYYVFLVS